MQENFVTPQIAVNYLMDRHRQKLPLRARITLLGAIRAGVIEWRCEQWRETYVAENGATFDEAGGWTRIEPKSGWPNEFWADALAVDNVFWRTNTFVSIGQVNLRSAPAAVARWLSANGGGFARWTRTAETVLLNLDHVWEHLSGAGWTAFAGHSSDRSSPRPLSGHYRAALIQMIATAAIEPDRVRTSTFECLEHAFQTVAPTRVPDDADLKRLAKEIRMALSPDVEAPED